MTPPARSAWPRPLTALFLVCLALTLSLVASPATALSATGQRVLVVTEDASPYSHFLASLTSRGFHVSTRSLTASSPALTAFDERQFDHVVFLSTDASSASASTSASPPSGDVSPQSLVAFAKDGGNILFAYGSSRADWFRDLAREFSIEVVPRGERLVDHFHYAVTKGIDAAGDHSAILVPSGETLADNSVVFLPWTLAASAASTPLLVRDASPHRLGPNPLAFPLLTLPSTSYARGPTSGGDDDDDDDVSLTLLGTDADVALASAFQLKANSARVTFVGSLDIFSDALLPQPRKPLLSSDGSKHPATLNEDFTRDVTSWTFQEHGVLKVERVSHYRVRTGPADVREPYEEPAEGGEAKMYRIKDTVRYGLELAQHTPAGWAPAPTDLDLQVSLVMIDPFVTASLSAVGQQPRSDVAGGSADLALNGTAAATTRPTTEYAATLKLPDRLGVYTLTTHWSRPGWSFVLTRDTAPIRAFNHDENPRFLPATWPYVAGSFSTIGGFLLFVALWLLAGERQTAAVVQGQDGDEDEKKTQ